MYASFTIDTIPAVLWLAVDFWLTWKDASQCNDQFSPGFQAVPKSLLKYWLFLWGSVSKIFQTLHDGNPC